MGRRNREIKDIDVLNNRRMDREWNTAIYARLSCTNNGLEDSRSLDSQVDYAKQYILKNPCLKLIDIYIDNGHTGTDFQRPEFLRLMDDIKTGKIDCIVVKDLSRFGRNYLEAGYYIEKIFPYLNVRFISINDQIDSMDESTKSAIVLPIKNLINEMYSKDISRKITATLRMKEKKGEMYYGKPPYGYVRDPQNPFHLLVDEQAQPYVHMIFAWAKMGLLPGQIAHRLDEIKAPIPSDTPCGKKYINRNKRNRREYWSVTSVKYILQSPVYVGDTVYNRSRQSVAEGIPRTKKGREEWYVIPDTHEGYWSRQDYESTLQLADERCRQIKRQRDSNKEVKSQNPDVLSGLFFCAECGRKMHYHREIKNKKLRFCHYECSSARKNVENKCVRNPVNDRLIRTIVLDQIRMQVSAACKVGNLMKELMKEGILGNKEESAQKKVASLKENIAAMVAKRTRLYEDFAEGILTEEDYVDIKGRYDGMFKEASAALIVAEQELASIEKMLHPEQEIKKMLEDFGTDRKLSYEMAHAFIRRMEVDRAGTISIEFRFRDWIAELEGLEEIL